MTANNRSGRISKKLITVLVLTVMTGAIQGAGFLRRASTSPAALAPVTDVLAKTKGNPLAVIHVVEYSDFQCPACTRAAKSLKNFYEANPSKMYVEFRHYPIASLHPYAVTSAVFAECAVRQGKFWDYHDVLFEKNREWSRSLKVRERLMDIAEDTGLEMGAFEACVEDKAVEAKVLVEKSNAARRGVHATPTYFINGQMVVGARSLEEKLGELLSGGGQ
ncbi:MAG: thioredoxin domain-containing protein [Candidatus Omnitrophica bacterium]|nr:thioredoxin domain-containing protein [Candidatus Omnitrophota bacterium]